MGGAASRGRLARPAPQVFPKPIPSLMLRQILLSVVVLLFATQSFAQEGSDAKFLGAQAKLLHKYADDAHDDGFPQVAKRVWLMILSEYDPDHEGAREAVGYIRAGKKWVMDPDFRYPKEDNPDPKAAKSLRSKWDKLADKVAGNHKKLAREYAQASRDDRAKWHYSKVLFFDPTDEEAQGALEHQAVAGLTGTDLEKTLYDRSKLIEDVVAVEARKDYPVEVLAEKIPHEFLEKAKVEYITVQSELFTIHGDFEPELMVEAAKNAERAVRVMQKVFDGYKGFNPESKRWVRVWSFFQDKDTYRQIVSANAELMSEAELKFTLEQTAGTMLSRERRLDSALKVTAPQNEQGVYDSAVRNVAHEYAGFGTAALREGIGHTIVGMFFNNNRVFIVDRAEQLRTTSGEEDVDKFSPNMDTWKDLALEAAWKLGEGTPAANLPLITADKFPDDARIKSWSFCDYVVRRDPTLLATLDSMADRGTPMQVETEFTKANAGESLADIEKGWKDFWTGASPVLKALQSNTEPLTAVSPKVKEWLTGFNKARKDQGSPPVTWSATYSGRCQEHAEYLLAHEELRGAVHEQSQDISLEGGSHLGDMFAQMALVSTDAGKAKKVFEAWLDFPGYRDALLNERLLSIGLYEEDSILVLDCIRGVGRPPQGRGGTRYFPGAGDKGVPTTMRVEDLGPEVRALLDKHEHQEVTEVGYPISLHHFGIGGLQGNRESYSCKVTIQGQPVEGIMHLADGGENRRSSAPGMVVFYPLQPLRKGAEVKVLWTYDDEQSTARKEIEFNT